MIIDTDRLMTQTNYAKFRGCTKQYVTQLIRETKVEVVEIDGVKFILVDQKKNRKIITVLLDKVK